MSSGRLMMDWMLGRGFFGGGESDLVGDLQIRLLGVGGVKDLLEGRLGRAEGGVMLTERGGMSVNISVQGSGNF